MRILRKYRWLSGGICSRCCTERRLTYPRGRPARSRPILAPRHDVEHNFCERVYTACPKIRELGKELSHFTREWKVQSKSFKLHPFRSNTRIKPINEFFETCFILIWRNFTQNACYVTKNNRTGPDPENKEGSRWLELILRPKNCGLWRICARVHYHGEATVSSVLGTNSSDSCDQTLHNSKVEISVDGLAWWNELAMNQSITIKKSYEHSLDLTFVNALFSVLRGSSSSDFRPFLKRSNHLKEFVLDGALSPYAVRSLSKVWVKDLPNWTQHFIFSLLKLHFSSRIKNKVSFLACQNELIRDTILKFYTLVYEAFTNTAHTSRSRWRDQSFFKKISFRTFGTHRYEARLLSPSPCSSANNRSFSCDIICELRNAKSCKASVSAFCFISRRFITSFILDARPRIVELLSPFSVLLSSPRSLSSTWAMTWELCAARSYTVSLLIRWFFKLSWNFDWSVWIITLVSSTSFCNELVTAYVSRTYCCTVLCITLMETASLSLVGSARLYSLLLSMSYCPSSVILNPSPGGPRFPRTLFVNCRSNTSTLAIRRWLVKCLSANAFSRALSFNI